MGGQNGKRTRDGNRNVRVNGEINVHLDGEINIRVDGRILVCFFLFKSV